MERIIVEEKNGVCVPMKITPICRIISVEKRLPIEEKKYLTDNGIARFERPSLHGFNMKDGWKQEYNESALHPKWWIEETELPSDEEIETDSKIHYPSWYTDYEEGRMRSAFIKGMKRMRELVLAAAPLTACR